MVIISIIAALAALWFIFPFLLRLLDDFIYRVQNNIVVCPRCHRTLKRVNVKCPNCNNVFANLYPTRAHPFYLKCSCGTRLATTRLFGRTKYESFCPRPNCMAPLGVNASEGRIVGIPIVGSAAAGKTTFLMSSLNALTSEFPSSKGWKTSFPFKSDEIFAKKLHANFKKGEAPDKTNELVPHAFCLNYETGALSENLRVCVYDPSGEAFTRHYERLKEQGYYDFMAGLILVVDPFALPALRKKYQNRLQEVGEGFSVSVADQMECLDRLLIRLNDPSRWSPDDSSDAVYYNLGSIPLKELPCAVVLTKVDAFDLDKYIGAEGVKRFRAKYPRYTEEEATDRLCRYWLKRWGGYNLLANLNNTFGQTRCFAVSTFGKPDIYFGYENGFKPYNIAAPFNWLLGKAGSRGMNKWGVSLFLFCVVLSLVAIGWGAYKLSLRYGASPAEVPSASASVDVPEPAAPEGLTSPAEEAAWSRYRTFCADAYDTSARVVVFDREQVEQTVLLLRPYVDANDKTDLEYLSTLALADKLREYERRYNEIWRVDETRTAAQFDDQVDAARREVDRLAVTAREIRYKFYVDNSAPNEQARKEMDEVRHCARRKFEQKAGQLAFRQYLIKGQAESAAITAQLKELSRKVVDAETDWDVLLTWCEFDAEFRLHERRKHDKTDATAERKRREAAAVVEAARKEIDALLSAVEHDVVVDAR